MIAAYVILAFLLSWLPWPLVLLNPASSPMVPFGPLIAAVVVAALSGTSRQLFAQLGRWRAKARWYLAAVLVPVAITGLAAALTVAVGGTRHQNVPDVRGRLDHRAPDETALERRYAHDRHTVRLSAGGLLARLASSEEIMVNSLHSQGIDEPAPGLAIEAAAPDGQIEAVRVEAASFAVGVQWHPEFPRPLGHLSQALFTAFGDACRARAASRSGHLRAAE
jgi:putative glutamine amidotransferase